MEGTYYETDRFFGIIVLLVFGVILYAVFKWEENRSKNNRRCRAKSQAKNRKERNYRK